MNGLLGFLFLLFFGAPELCPAEEAEGQGCHDTSWEPSYGDTPLDTRVLLLWLRALCPQSGFHGRGSVPAAWPWNGTPEKPPEER